MAAAMCPAFIQIIVKNHYLFPFPVIFTKNT